MNNYRNNFFSLAVSHAEFSTEMRMEMLIPVTTTKSIPRTIGILKKTLPSIFLSKCFNAKNYTFYKEVKNTEIAHLFEHIVLEQIGLLKRGMGYDNPVHNGVTRWNWLSDAEGVFHITIDIGHEDYLILEIALLKSIEILDSILDSAITPALSIPKSGQVGEILKNGITSAVEEK